MSLTTDPNDPELKRYTGKEEPGPQHTKYLVLSDEEIAKGFTRPLRRAYIHVGLKAKYPLLPLTQEQKDRYDSKYGYVMFEAYPESESSAIGRFWTQAQLDAQKGCGSLTTMGLKLCETYARDPTFYGATYCCGCQKHLPVGEFVWDEDGEVVGS